MLITSTRRLAGRARVGPDRCRRRVTGAGRGVGCCWLPAGGEDMFNQVLAALVVEGLVVMSAPRVVVATRVWLAISSSCAAAAAPSPAGNSTCPGSAAGLGPVDATASTRAAAAAPPFPGDVPLAGWPGWWPAGLERRCRSSTEGLRLPATSKELSRKAPSKATRLRDERRLVGGVLATPWSGTPRVAMACSWPRGHFRKKAR
mmetsp:Transcript_67308/g.179527  ORF Transcript_67308/g.179527 Transcript_67308/m.179527 type:complete len:203 (-) Transcript_67308:12-620(-)